MAAVSVVRLLGIYILNHCSKSVPSRKAGRSAASISLQRTLTFAVLVLISLRWKLDPRHKASSDKRRLAKLQP
jgi:hypothetical protein